MPFIGSLTKMKGMYELLTAVKLCAERKVNVKLLIVGEKPKKALGAETYILNKLDYDFKRTRDFCRRLHCEK